MYSIDSECMKVKETTKDILSSGNSKLQDKLRVYHVCTYSIVFDPLISCDLHVSS